MDSTYLLNDENVNIIRLETIDRDVLYNNGSFYQKFFIDNKSNYTIDVFVKYFSIKGKVIFRERYIKKGIKPKQKVVGSLFLTCYDIENYEITAKDFDEYNFVISYVLDKKEISSKEFCEKTINEYDY